MLRRILRRTGSIQEWIFHRCSLPMGQFINVRWRRYTQCNGFSPFRNPRKRTAHRPVCGRRDSKAASAEKTARRPDRNRGTIRNRHGEDSRQPVATILTMEFVRSTMSKPQMAGNWRTALSIPSSRPLSTGLHCAWKAAVIMLSAERNLRSSSHDRCDGQFSRHFREEVETLMHSLWSSVWESPGRIYLHNLPGRDSACIVRFYVAKMRSKPRPAEPEDVCQF